MKVKNSRIRDGENLPSFTHELTLSKAYEQFAYYELGYGGSVSAVTEGSITVRTDVFGCVDYAEFSGTKEELRPFYELAYIECQMTSDDEVTQAVSRSAFNQLERFIETDEKWSTPFVVKPIGDRVMGQISTKVAMLQAHNLQELQDLPFREVVDAMMLMLDGDPRDVVLAAYKKESGVS